MNFKKIIVFDTETTGIDTNVCSIVELAAVVIDPRKIEIVPNSEFTAFLKPDPDTINKDTLEWHANLHKTTSEEILKKWNGYQEPEKIWQDFMRYTKMYHTKQDRQTMFTAPIPAGMNILSFDIPIVNRYHAMYGDKRALFTGRDKIDLMNWFFIWFENNAEIKSYSMDDMREYFGMSSHGAHTALQDVKDCAHIICRFMKMQRRIAEKTKFKGAFADVRV